jgi:hypothetical protein
VYIKNPGGLETSRGTFTVAFKKPVDIYVAAAYAPLLALHGDLFRAFDSTLYPAGAQGRLGLIPVKKHYGYFGFELDASWNFLNLKNDVFTSQLYLTGAQMNFLYQRRLRNRSLALNFRAGAGVMWVLDYHFNFGIADSEPLSSFYVKAGAGVSFQWFITRRFFIDAGLEYSTMFVSGEVSPGFILPLVGLGLQF